MNTTELEEATTKLYSTGRKGQPSVGRHERDRQYGENLDAWKSWLQSEYLPGSATQLATAVFVKAWVTGHAEGFGSVEQEYEELAAIVKLAA